MQVVIAAWATRGYKRRNFIANDTIPTQAPQLRARSPPCIPLHIHNVRGFQGTVTRSPRNSINERKREGGGGERGSEIEIGSFHVLARSFLLLLPSLFFSLPPPPIALPRYRHPRALSRPQRLAPIKINKCILPRASAYWSTGSRGANEAILLPFLPPLALCLRVRRTDAPFSRVFPSRGDSPAATTRFWWAILCRGIVNGQVPVILSRIKTLMDWFKSSQQYSPYNF